jgi:hypothetical protein
VAGDPGRLQELPEIGTGGPVGYFGINMGTAIGVPLVAIDARSTAAVFDQHWPDVLAEKAKPITIPIEFDMQWDDEQAQGTAQVRGRQRGRVEAAYPDDPRSRSLAR